MTKQKNKNHIILFFLICFLFILFPLFSVKAIVCCKNIVAIPPPECSNDDNRYFCEEKSNISECEIEVLNATKSCSEVNYCAQKWCCKNGFTCSEKSRIECQKLTNGCVYSGKKCDQVSECEKGGANGCCVNYLPIEGGVKINCVDNIKLLQCAGTFKSGKFCADISNCPQYTGTKLKEEETKPQPPLKFIPSVTIPGSNFVAGKGIDVSGNLIGQYISAIFEFAVAVSAFLAVVMIMLAGIKWMLAAGSSEKVGSAKKMIGNAIIGLILSLATYTILSLINPNLVFLKNINVTPIKPVPLEIGGDVNEQVPFYTGSLMDFNLKIAKCAEGGWGDLLRIIGNLQGKITYRLGGKGGPPPYPSEKDEYKKICPDYGNKICLDCSGFISYIYQCLGMDANSHGVNGGTEMIFGTNGESSDGKIIKFFGDKITLSSGVEYKLNRGDLLGWPPKLGRNGNSGHVIMYKGNSEFVDVASVNNENGRKEGKGLQVRKSESWSDFFYKTISPDLKRGLFLKKF